MYTGPHAARLLRVAPATLHYWLEGGSRNGKTYQPIIREHATGSKKVTWAEFVEAGLLREYRRDLNVPMVQLRGFIDSLRSRLGVPYPLAHARPFVSGRELVWKAQEEAHLDAEYALVTESHGGQYLLAPAAEAFFRRVTWSPDDLPATWLPAPDTAPLVVIDPDVRFGAPSVGGVSTAILFEQAEGGEDAGELAVTYGLTQAQVESALEYELIKAA